MIYTNLTKKALKISFNAHKNQVDKTGVPYVFHPFHLAEQMDDDELNDESIPFKDKYGSMTDEEIVLLCHSGDISAEEYLLNKFKHFVRSKARSYFLIGADHEDIVQEGMIGLYKAIGVYDETKNHSFSAFASLCIHRQEAVRWSFLLNSDR